MKKDLRLLFLVLVCFSATSIVAQTFAPIDINSGSGSSDPYSQISFSGKVFFAATTPAYGTELWTSDGTPAGTSLFLDISPGSLGSEPSSFIAVGNLLFFTANDNVHGNELWVTDGTVAGTHITADANPGAQPSDPVVMTPWNGKLYYRCDDGVHGGELWVSDGTAGGTALLKDILPGAGEGYPSNEMADPLQNLKAQFLPYNGYLYFAADDGVHGNELWRTDGSSTNTTMVADILPGPGSSYPDDMTLLNNIFVLGASDSIHGQELWISDGTASGTNLVKDINTGPFPSNPGFYAGFIALAGKLYFGAYQASTGYELWMTDGTTSGTALVRDILPGPGSSQAGTSGMALLGNKIFFAANDSVNGFQLWSSDGTSGGTAMVKALSSPTVHALPHAFIRYNSQLIFVANYSNNSDEQLWTTDGTGANTHIIAPTIAPNLGPLASNLYGSSICYHNNSLFITANFNSIGNEMWIYTTPSTTITEVGTTSAISAYPNPFCEIVSVSGLSDQETYTVSISDVSGRDIYNSSLQPTSGQASIQMHDISAGIYLIHISDISAQQTFKMIKQ